jgi:hypothetical protein
MDESTLEQVLSLEDLLSKGDIGGLFKSYGMFIQVAYTFDKKCDFNELFFELGQWVLNGGTDLSKVNENFQNNLFTLTGTLNELAEIFFNSERKIDWTDLDGAFSTYKKLG